MATGCSPIERKEGLNFHRQERIGMASPGAGLRIKIPELEGDPERGEICNGLCAHPPAAREKPSWFRSWLPVKKEEPEVEAMRREMFTVALIGIIVGTLALFLSFLGTPGIRWDGVLFGLAVYCVSTFAYFISTS
jgi:hypothetical protein